MHYWKLLISLLFYWKIFILVTGHLTAFYFLLICTLLKKQVSQSLLATGFEYEYHFIFM